MRDANSPAAPGADVRTLAGSLAYAGLPDSPASVRARHRDARARAARAAATLGACWGCAVVAVFLPLLHFVLVPGLLLLGPALAWQRLHEADTLIDATGACPACASVQHLALGGSWRARTPVRCEGCGRAIEVVLPDVPPAPAA